MSIRSDKAQTRPHRPTPLTGCEDGYGPRSEDSKSPFSSVGRKLTQHSAILELMDDLGRAMTTDPDMLMLGGGNPASVPDMEALWRQQFRDMMGEGNRFDRMLENYDPPQGNPIFLEAFADLLSRLYGWSVSPENIAITNGTQTAFFILFNLLAGQNGSGPGRKILLPLSPEYIGYADQGLGEGTFVSCRPVIEWPEGEQRRIFKYHVDFDAVEERLRVGDIAAVAVSRPTNPSGNTLTEQEVERLSELSARHGAHLIVDGAYGVPFPGVIFAEARPHWGPHVINTFSLSKLGIPGVRTGIVVAAPEIIAAIRSVNAIVGLANGNVGQQLVLPLVRSGDIVNLGPRILQPFYAERSRLAQQAARELLEPTGVNWAMHANEGGFFLWLWFRNLPVSTLELYERLKSRRVLVVPGEFFYYGLSDPWSHTRECLRLSFAQKPEIVREGIRRLAEEVGALLNEVG